MALITRPEEAVEMLNDLIELNAGSIGIEFVGKYDESLIPRYPAVIVSAGAVTKEVHASHTFNVTLRCILWVYHAKITLTHAQRSKEDLELATNLSALVESDKKFAERVIFSFIESEAPGLVAPRAGKGEPIVGTRLAWECLTQQRWD